MKVLTLLGFVMTFSLFAAAQNTSDSTQLSKKRNELKLNVLNAILSFPEVSYERIFSDESSVGISFAATLEYDNLFLDNYWLMLTPYYRLYFGKKTSGLFIEANATLVNANRLSTFISYNSNREVINSGIIDRKETNFGMGAAIGIKFLNKHNYVGEFLGGAGRFFGDAYHKIYPRIGITIGKRF